MPAVVGAAVLFIGLGHAGWAAALVAVAGVGVVLTAMR